MVDPRLHEVYRYNTYRPPPYMLRSRREIPENIRKYFHFPEEFYPPLEENSKSDPDVQQDWYQMEGFYAGDYHSVNALERAASFKEFLSNLPDKEIIIITSNCFVESLVMGEDFEFAEQRVCVWQPTVSGRKKLVPLESFQSSEVKLT